MHILNWMATVANETKANKVGTDLGADNHHRAYFR